MVKIDGVGMLRPRKYGPDKTRRNGSSQKLTLFEQRVRVIDQSCPGRNKVTTQMGGDEHQRFKVKYDVIEGDLAHASTYPVASRGSSDLFTQND